jgi:hypothetical protein
MQNKSSQFFARSMEALESWQTIFMGQREGQLSLLVAWQHPALKAGIELEKSQKVGNS